MKRKNYAKKEKQGNFFNPAKAKIIVRVVKLKLSFNIRYDSEVLN